jgi:hypothetical protein
MVARTSNPLSRMATQLHGWILGGRDGDFRSDWMDMNHEKWVVVQNKRTVSKPRSRGITEARKSRQGLHSSLHRILRGESE